MVADVVRELGFLTLGSRFKRLGERLQAQTEELLKQDGIEVPASHMPLLAALDRLGPSSVGGIAQALGTSQPGVTRQLTTLQGLDLVSSSPSPADQRQRCIALTPRGRQLVARVRRGTWPAIEASVVDACGPGGASMLAQLAQLEDALSLATLRQRSASLRARRDRHASA
jgi:DNA-binding MarR family transcriptional regulator